MSLFKKVKFIPFDNLPFSTAEDEIYAVPFSIANRNAPDFSNKISLTLGTTYTVGSGALVSYTKGYLFAGCTARSDDSGPKISFNGVTATLMGYDNDYGGDLSGYCIFIAVRKGDYFKVPTSKGTPKAWFVPTKG